MKILLFVFLLALIVVSALDPAGIGALVSTAVKAVTVAVGVPAFLAWAIWAD